MPFQPWSDATLVINLFGQWQLSPNNLCSLSHFTFKNPYFGELVGWLWVQSPIKKQRKKEKEGGREKEKKRKSFASLGTHISPNFCLPWHAYPDCNPYHSPINTFLWRASLSYCSFLVRQNQIKLSCACPSNSKKWTYPVYSISIYLLCKWMYQLSEFMLAAHTVHITNSPCSVSFSPE